MKSILKIILKVIIFCIIINFISIAVANEVTIEQQGDSNYLTYLSSNVSSVYGYNIKIIYEDNINIQKIELVEPYIGDSYIDNENGYAQIVGFTGSNEHNNQLAYFTYSGNGDFTILIYELIDENLNDIDVVNEVITMPEIIENTPSVAQPHNTNPHYPIIIHDLLSEESHFNYVQQQKDFSEVPVQTPKISDTQNTPIIDQDLDREPDIDDPFSSEIPTYSESSNESNTASDTAQASLSLISIPIIFGIPILGKKFIIKIKK